MDGELYSHNWQFEHQMAVLLLNSIYAPIQNSAADYSGNRRAAFW
jgi:hypothetical protein